MTERMPPSMHRRPASSPLRVIVGQTPGTAQLAATASTRGTPQDASRASSAPSAVSIVVTTSRASGQRVTPRRPAMISSRSCSGTRLASRAQAPTRARPSSGLADCATAAPRAFTIASRSRSTDRSAGAGSSCAAYSSARSAPLRSRVPTTDPADVPTTRSAAPRSTPSSASAVSSPISQAMPARPPPPRTSARVGASGIGGVSWEEGLVRSGRGPYPPAWPGGMTRHDRAGRRAGVSSAHVRAGRPRPGSAGSRIAVTSSISSPAGGAVASSAFASRPRARALMTTTSSRPLDALVDLVAYADPVVLGGALVCRPTVDRLPDYGVGRVFCARSCRVADVRYGRPDERTSFARRHNPWTRAGS